MPILLTRATTFENVMQLLGLLIVFLFVLAATYFTSKWVGANGQGKTKNRNINVIETYKLNQNKYIQIIKVTDKYLVVAVSKDTVEFLTEIDEKNIISSANNENLQINFKQILNKISNKERLDIKNKNN